MRHRHARWTLLAVILGLAPACSSDTVANAFNWSSLAPLLVPRADHALVSLGGYLYAVGGYSGSTLARVDRYDPVSDTWTRSADMQAARREFAAGALNGKIYVACGMRWTDPNSVTYVMTTEAYDPATDSWTTLAPCPIDTPYNSVYGNVHIGGAVANGRLYVMVFNTDTFGGTATYAYDPGTDTWAVKAPPPFSYAGYSVAELEGALYLLASDSYGTTMESKLAQYDPVEDIWIIGPTLAGVRSPAVVGLNGKLYAVGGTRSYWGSPAPVADVNQYEPLTGNWSSGGNMGVPRYLAGAAALGGEPYVVGGSATSDPYPATLLPLTAVETGVPP